mmetsp:Transcript_25368/g.22497  ORF Transcript_25368/g.22497 Transcript_25368/m.22497 type:complete len:282 (-) Transcript_25368:572-1417(-)
MISDYAMENIYLFGGIVSELDEVNVYKNDMWKYYTFSDKWEEIIPFGINSISRRVYLWDGSFLDRSVLDETPSKYYTKDGDDVNYLPSNTDSTNYVKLPEVRAGHSMNLIGNPPYYILVYGGFHITSETQSGSTLKIRENLEDLWSFSLYSRKWHQVYVNSVDNPSGREGNIMITVNLERLVLMYGGFKGDTIFDEAWYFNLFTNMWQKLEATIDSSISNAAIPPGLVGHSFISSEHGLVIYGGQTWYSTDLDRVEDSGSTVITDKSLTYITDVYVFPLYG